MVKPVSFYHVASGRVPNVFPEHTSKHFGHGVIDSSKLVQKEMVARLWTIFASSVLWHSTTIPDTFSEPCLASGKVYITWRRIMPQSILVGINNYLKSGVQTQLASVVSLVIFVWLRKK